MIKLQIKEKSMRLPVGGHHFPEPGLTVTGASFEEVVLHLLEFRRNNAKPIGEPDQDVLAYYAKNWPYLVEVVDGEPEVEEPDYVAWKKWVQTTWKIPPSKLLTPKEAQARCGVCENCPHNKLKGKDWSDNLDYEETFKRAYLLRQGVPPQGKVFFCALHKCDIPVLSYLDKPTQFVRSNASSLQPAECWVK